MPKRTQTWIRIGDVPEAVKPLLMLYNQHYDGLHHTNNVIREMWTGWVPRLTVQQHGFVDPFRLYNLAAAAKERGWSVEVEPVAPSYYYIHMYGTPPPRGVTDGMWGGNGELADVGIRFRPFRKRDS